MLMDIDTLATIQRERQQELMRQVEQARLLRLQKESTHVTFTTAPTHTKPSNVWATLQQKLAAVFQMRTRPVLPH